MHPPAPCQGHTSRADTRAHIRARVPRTSGLVCWNGGAVLRGGCSATCPEPDLSRRAGPPHGAAAVAGGPARCCGHHVVRARVGLGSHRGSSAHSREAAAGPASAIECTARRPQHTPASTRGQERAPRPSPSVLSQRFVGDIRSVCLQHVPVNAEDTGRLVRLKLLGELACMQPQAARASAAPTGAPIASPLPSHFRGARLVLPARAPRSRRGRRIGAGHVAAVGGIPSAHVRGAVAFVGDRGRRGRYARDRGVGARVPVPAAGSSPALCVPACAGAA